MDRSTHSCQCNHKLNESSAHIIGEELGKNHLSPFAPNLSCCKDRIHSEKCRAEEGFCTIPVIFDRRYDYGNRRLCSRNFSLRLGGMTNGMAAKLREYLESKIKLGYQCESESKTIEGWVSYVGSDFVEIQEYKKYHLGKRCRRRKRYDKYTMIPFDSINWIEEQEGSA